MAHLSSSMEWEPTHSVYKQAWQPPMSGRFAVVANERDHPDWMPSMPGAFVQTPLRHNDAGLTSVDYQLRYLKRTAEGAQFEDRPQYVEESGIQPFGNGRATMTLRSIITAVCWFAGATWETAQWTYRKTRQVQVTDIHHVAANGFISIKRRATEVMRPTAPTVEQITHQRRSQNPPRESSSQPPRYLRRTRQEPLHIPASAQLRSRIPSREHTVTQNKTDGESTSLISPPQSPPMVAMSLPESQGPKMEKYARVEDEPSTEDDMEEMVRIEARLRKIREKKCDEERRIEEMRRPKSLDEMIAVADAEWKQTHVEKMPQESAEDLALKKSQQIARVKAQQEAREVAQQIAREMRRSTTKKTIKLTGPVTRPWVQLLSPQMSEDEAEDEAEKVAKQKVPLRSILKRNRQQEAHDEPLPSIQPPILPLEEGQKVRDEGYIDYFLLPEVYEEAKVLEARVEGGLKSLALESSTEHLHWKSEEDEKKKKAIEDYDRMVAEELARAQAEAEQLAKELAEEEAAREPHTGRRRLQTKLVQLSDEWHHKIDQAMRKGEGVALATTLDGTQLTKRDFVTVLGQEAWLNDNIINSYVDIVVEHANKKAGRNQRDKTPKVVAQSSFFYKKIRDDGPKSVSRWMRRKRAAGKNLLEVETMLIPVNNSAHWTMIVVSPKARTIEYLDSFGGSKDVFIRNTKAWLAVELGSLWNEDDWSVLDTKSARQYNGFDCGVFAITNAECVAGGVTTTSYDGDDMAMQRRRIAAVLLNGGFTGDLEAAEDVDM